MVNDIPRGSLKERPESLSGKYEGSFAYATICERLPDILTKVIDQFVQVASNDRSDGKIEKAEDAKSIISKLVVLKNEMQTDKGIVKLLDKHEDVKMWNDFLTSMPILVENKDAPTWYSVAWLSCECYLYRRIFEAVQLSRCHQSYDPFFDQKSKAFYSSEKPMQTLASYLIKFVNNSPGNSRLPDEELRLDFEMFLEYCLWGNKCDLSISSGTHVSNQLKESSQLKQLLEHIISNNTEEVWLHVKSITSNGKPTRIDFVLDNSGFELFTDLCLAEFLLNQSSCEEVYFHVKSMPWFISDVTAHDFQWTLQQCSMSNDNAVQRLGIRWNTRLAEKTFVIVENLYWTLPHDYSLMRKFNLKLYNDLANSQLIIFKGDLNYRKLIGDRSWAHTTEFAEALHGFCPAPICSLRTLKADLVVGLRSGQDIELSRKEENWMVSGKYAVIQFCDKL